MSAIAQSLRTIRRAPRSTHRAGSGTASRWAPPAEQDLDREIDAITRALEEHGATDRDQLAELVGARFWGPGRFRSALREAVDEDRAQRLSWNTYAPGALSAVPTGR